VLANDIVGWEGPFHVWAVETKKKKVEAICTIAELNTKGAAEKKKLDSLWRQSVE